MELPSRRQVWSDSFATDAGLLPWVCGLALVLEVKMSKSPCRYGYLPVRDRFGSADGSLQNAGEVTSLSSGFDLSYTNRRSREKESSMSATLIDTPSFLRLHG